MTQLIFLLRIEFNFNGYNECCISDAYSTAESAEGRIVEFFNMVKKEYTEGEFDLLPEVFSREIICDDHS